jgi:hypothetical protein
VVENRAWSSYGGRHLVVILWRLMMPMPASGATPNGGASRGCGDEVEVDGEEEAAQPHDHAWDRVEIGRLKSDPFQSYRCAVCSQVWKL